MQFRGRTLKPIDYAIVATTAAVLVVAGYLGWSLWAYDRAVVNATPATRAIAELSAHLRRYPDDVGVRLQLAQALVVGDRDQEAIGHYRAVLKVQEDNIAALSGLGFLAAERKDWETAEGYWARVIDVLEPNPMSLQDTNLEKAYFYMGSILGEQRRWDEAIPYFKAALRIKRDAADTYYLLAAAYRETGAEGLYREQLDIALAFDPLMPEGNYDLGQLLLEEGDEAGAAERFRTSADAAPNAEKPRQALDALGPYAERYEAARASATSDPKGALKEARIAVALEPRRTEALHLLAQLYEKTGDKPGALKVWRRVVAMNAQDASATAAIGRLAPGAK